MTSNAKPGKTFPRTGVYHSDLANYCADHGPLLATVTEVKEIGFDKGEKEWKARLAVPGDKTYLVYIGRDGQAYFDMWYGAPINQQIALMADDDNGPRVRFGNPSQAAPPAAASPTPQPSPGPTPQVGPQQGGSGPAPQPANPPAAQPPHAGGVLPSAVETVQDSMVAASLILTHFVDVDELTPFERTRLLIDLAGNVGACAGHRNMEIFPNGKPIPVAHPWGYRKGRLVPPGQGAQFQNGPVETPEAPAPTPQDFPEGSALAKAAAPAPGPEMPYGEDDLPF